MKSKTSQPKPREVHWGIKLHLNTTTIDASAKPMIDSHNYYRTEGKERPILILCNRNQTRAGSGTYKVAYVTSKNYDQNGNQRSDLVPFSFRQGTQSYAELPEDIPEEFIHRYETTLHEQYFREIKRKLTAILTQSIRQD